VYDPAVPQSLSCIYVHAVFSTKLRQPFLADASHRAEIHSYIGGICKRLECSPIAIGGTEDHVHILARLARVISISDWVKETKRVSSAFATQRLAGFGWQAGYGAFSVDPGSLDRISAYVNRQEEHHRVVSFQDEFRRLLEEHSVAWDERYVWD